MQLANALTEVMGRGHGQPVSRDQKKNLMGILILLVTLCSFLI